jgi:RHS repeat-associated protein
LGSIFVQGSSGTTYSLTGSNAGMMYYAGNGNVLNANDSENGNWTYGYDSVNRLQTATIGGQNFNYYYTADGSNGQYGNMTCTAPAGYACTPLGLSFSSANNQITTSGYSYDASGNVLSDRTHGYVYDAESRLTCVLGTDGTCTSSTATNYFYDPQGQRVGKQQADTLEDYVYDPQGHMISVHDGSANLLRSELYSPDGRHVATWDGNTWSTSLLFWNHADWLGTERVRTSSSGSVAQSFTDTPYGMNAYYNASSDISPMHFTGLQYDYETGMSHTLNRQYPAVLGRWLTPDPIRLTSDRLADPQQLNLYAYVRNSPLELVDPTGMILKLFGNIEADLGMLCLIVGQENCNRLSVGKNGIVSFNTEGLDMSHNEGAELIYNLTWDQFNVYGLSEGPTVETAGGAVNVDYITNLDNRYDSRYRNGKRPTDMPEKGVDDMVAINPSPSGTVVSLTDLKLAERWTQAFHELEEAWMKINGGMQYEAAHEAARLREDALRDQRPYLTGHNPGSGGPVNGPSDTIRFVIKK